MPLNEDSSISVASASCGPSCDCAPTTNLLPRRNFVALAGLALAGSAIGARREAMAGPFAPSDFERLIPADKKLHPDWVRSLYARGEPAIYTKKNNELHFIGMPVGGICAGTLYLGGDGRLWVWDIFNQNRNGILPRVITADIFGVNRQLSAQDGSGYVRPHEQESPLTQGFAIKVEGVVRTLDAKGWDDVSFEGRYPMATVRYSDPASLVSASLTAYSPFIPLDADDSGLPATICEITIKNVHGKAMDVEVGGWLENAVRLYSAQTGVGARTNTHKIGANSSTTIFCEFDGAPHAAPEPARPDIPLESFEQGTYGLWKSTGTAFGSGPVARANVPAYQGPLGGEGKYVVNTHAAAPGDNVGARDAATGTLISPEFTIDRLYITFDVGGGANIEQVGVRLLIDGNRVRHAGGRDENPMHRAVFDVSSYAGKRATLEAYDHATGPWGHVGFNHVIMTDHPGADPLDADSSDAGTMALALLEPGIARASLTPAILFDAPAADTARKPTGDPLIGGIAKTVHLAPGVSRTLTFVVAWHFPNTKLPVKDSALGNHYAVRFHDASAVVDYIATNHARLSQQTRLWTDTWYDSTLPHWFLDRTFANTSILATTTAHRFANGRFWAWEGVGCCEGTCTHVWHYAQAVGRIFPELERHTREFVDFGVALDPATGRIGYRGENTGPAVDGQAGRILGAYREHQMSADDAFLRRIWPRVRAATEFLIHHDANDDGLLDGAQENTLDAAWFGKIAWLSSLYAAALQASAQMANAVGDNEFAVLCDAKFNRTKNAIETQLFNGEYFVQLPESGHEKSLGTYQTCHIDQVHGQSWAWQVSLGRILDRARTVSALKSLYKYNFTPDVAPFRRKYTAGRPYALAGDGGLIMATNPRETPHPFGNQTDWQYGYFNECMSGFEHQAASHMIAEGMVEEGLAVTRAVHDRYHPARRNPYNEIECSDHYSRSMASYGSFLTACGFEYHGPNGHIGFAPRLTPDDFRAAFTAAEGWGTYSQKRADDRRQAVIAVKWGRLRVKTIALQHVAVNGEAKLTIKVNGKHRDAALEGFDGGRCLVTLASAAMVEAGERLEVRI